MPNGRYRFSRSEDISGFISSNTPSTDALNALAMWSGSGCNRVFDVLVDEEEQLLARLKWSGTDTSAGTDLDKACNKFGVNRFYDEAVGD